jgi:small subunit ribosomal protein S1
MPEEKPESEDKTADESPDAEPQKPAGKGAANEEDFASMFAASEAQATRQEIAVGDVVRGRIIAVGESNAFVGVGAKGEAVMDLAEFRDPETGATTLAVGDEIEATVVDDGKRSGSIVLKRVLGRGGHVPAELEQALAHGIPVEGLVNAEKKGGFEVQIGSVHAFCPGSQIDLRRGGERVPAEVYVGQRFQFRVIKIESHGRNVVVSRRQLLEEEAAARAARTWEQLQEGAVLRGTVTSVRPFGAFVDLGGVEGLIHISEMSHGHVRNPEEFVQTGTEVEVKVIKVGPEEQGKRRQVGLSLRALQPDPWESVSAQFPVGTTVKGRVARLENFGAFVEISPGLDGLVHVSKMALDRRVSHPRQMVSEGDEVDVTVVAIDTEKRRIGLSMVEQARYQRDAAEIRERGEQQAAIAAANKPRSMGTLGDLLAASKKKQP